jgi:hypothetical protein
VGYLVRSGSSTAPVVIDGRVVTLRARTTSLPMKFGETRVVLSRACPDHVEVLDSDGQHETIRVHDYNFWARAVIFGGSAIAVVASRVLRSNMTRRNS